MSEYDIFLVGTVHILAVMQCAALMSMKKRFMWMEEGEGWVIFDHIKGGRKKIIGRHTA